METRNALVCYHYKHRNNDFNDYNGISTKIIKNLNYPLSEKTVEQIETELNAFDYMCIYSIINIMFFENQ